MKTLGQALIIGGLLLGFGGCDDDNDNKPPETINVRIAPDSGVTDAASNADGALLHCLGSGQLGSGQLSKDCFPLR
jgi:hypothetical protein